MNNIAIVGAGLIGRLTALSLTRQGYDITLIDKDSTDAHNSAAYAAAGLLTPLGEALHSNANMVAMGMESLTLWPELLSTLDDHTFFQRDGAIMVSHPQDKGDYDHVERYIRTHYPSYRADSLNRRQLESLEPELGRSFNHGLYLPDEGQIGNRKLLLALKTQLEQADVNWLSHSEVQAITPQANGCSVSYQEVRHERKPVHTQSFDLVIDCRGTGARNALNNNQTQALTDLRAVRGELFQLFAPDVHLSRPIRLMHPRYQLYIAPKGKGFYVVGATEIESDSDAPMTVRSAMELLSAAYSVHPGFAEANIRQHVAQCRPAFSDNQPKIIAQHHLIQVNGLYRHGFLIAPVVLKQLEQLVSSYQQHGEYNESSGADYQYTHWLPISTSPSISTNVSLST